AGPTLVSGALTLPRGRGSSDTGAVASVGWTAARAPVYLAAGALIKRSSTKPPIRKATATKPPATQSIVWLTRASSSSSLRSTLVVAGRGRTPEAVPLEFAAGASAAETLGASSAKAKGLALAGICCVSAAALIVAAPGAVIPANGLSAGGAAGSL